MEEFSRLQFLYAVFCCGCDGAVGRKRSRDLFCSVGFLDGLRWRMAPKAEEPLGGDGAPLSWRHRLLVGDRVLVWCRAARGGVWQRGRILGVYWAAGTLRVQASDGTLHTVMRDSLHLQPVLDQSPSPACKVSLSPAWASGAAGSDLLRPSRQGCPFAEHVSHLASFECLDESSPCSSSETLQHSLSAPFS